MTVIRNSPPIEEGLWMPFTAMRSFHDAPMLFERAEGMHYFTPDGRRVLDMMGGLWCVNAGHGHPRIVAAIREAAGHLDYVSSFRMGHPPAFAFARRLLDAVPFMARAFFSNSGSEAVDTALKIARAYHRARGEAGRTKFIGRHKSYHGVGFGGLSVGGIARHKRDFGPLLADVFHMPLPHDPAQRFLPGRPEADARWLAGLEDILAVQDPSTVAAVIVEPVTGSGGVYPPPLGYLEALREICTRHGILLIFDEVITGFGRLGACTASEALGVTPDILTLAKGLTNGAVPMGATLASPQVFEAFMNLPEGGPEFMHGYTYSAHPLACAAGMAAMDAYQEEGIFAAAGRIAAPFAEALLALRGAPHVIDARHCGVLGAVELAPRPGAPGARGAEVAERCFAEGVLIRAAGDTMVFSPPLVISAAQIEQATTTLARALHAVA
ncbi:aminotransferase class III-fold pyridoxal phosphate-dependent enzyme [Roseomonas sp. GC11]|uniref:aminotransferase class III-fold pyridoxal phosphate-dependent enzyme n=1 Tax=Roseomonas sp. GC11 TaxID=2950546 RepID=UPI0021095B0A|nr:aminotransferase class III-fold pyridoxal phosphate-dependent enzyme [Roseomonas sp. GC11]MCQ4159680.1 aminotransferase class III-fold pyridoxal phosphate-dependent enzyme [Roseomonas sp. GC11]